MRISGSKQRNHSKGKNEMPTDFKRLRLGGKGLKDRFIIIGSLVFVLPFLVLLYVFLEYDFPLDLVHLALFALVLLLVLSGVLILRFVFDSIFDVAKSIRNAAETGDMVSADMRKDVDELSQISLSFKSMVNALKETTEEINNYKSKLEKETAERKAAEELRSKYAFIINTSKNFMSLINRNYIYQAANDASCRAHKKTREEIIDHSVAEIWGEETFNNVIKDHMDKCLAGEDVHYEAWFEFEALGHQCFAVSYYPYFDDNGVITHAVVTTYNITDRVKTENQIKASLLEKENLLKEVYHRVKNNLQIISSLLNLQSGFISDKGSLEIFREMRDRIMAMALVHEKLYKSDNLTQIDFSGYIDDVGGKLFQSYEITPNTVTLETSLDKVDLSIDKAIPSGMIISELLSNCLKHAFPEGRMGKIEIALRREKNNLIHLTVKDNGIGFPADIDFRNTETFGLQLINSLVDQLHGTVEIERDGGTTFKITCTI